MRCEESVAIKRTKVSCYPDKLCLNAPGGSVARFLSGVVGYSDAEFVAFLQSY